MDASHLEYELAKAMYFQGYGRCQDALKEGVFNRSRDKDKFLQIARWAIEGFITTLHKPTDEMLDAGFKVLKVVGADDVLTAVWREMVSALARQQIKPVAPQLEHTP